MAIDTLHPTANLANFPPRFGRPGVRRMAPTPPMVDPTISPIPCQPVDQDRNSTVRGARDVTQPAGAVIESTQLPPHAFDTADALDAVGLHPLMEMTSGSPEVQIAVIDGPIAVDHSDLKPASIRQIGPSTRCATDGIACAHGTFVIGIMAARRGSGAPAICPGCTFVVRQIFSDTQVPRAGAAGGPAASAAELAQALRDVVEQGAQLINISATVRPTGTAGSDLLRQALEITSARGALVFAAAGDQATVGGSPLISHPSVIPVVAYSRQARPLGRSNLGRSIGLTGIAAPGEAVLSLAPDGGVVRLTGSSAAVAFATGAAGLLASLVPTASPAQIGLAIRRSAGFLSRRIYPAPFDAGLARTLLVTSLAQQWSKHG